MKTAIKEFTYCKNKGNVWGVLCSELPYCPLVYFGLA